MPVIRIETWINARPEVCFDLARDVDAHAASTARTGERAVAGVTHGLMNLGDEVTWEARHLGVRQRLTSRITAFDRPRSFVDEMVQGVFASFRHQHLFNGRTAGTVMVDVFEYRSPLGPLGRLADGLFLRRYMERLLRDRAGFLRDAAERFERVASDERPCNPRVGSEAAQLRAARIPDPTDAAPST